MLSITYLPALWLSLMLVGIFCEACLEKYIAILLTPSAAAALVCMISGGAPGTQLDVFVVSLSSLLIVRAVLALIHKHGAKRIDIEQLGPTRAVGVREKNRERKDKYDKER